jgi:GT2 family glycosyltransferase
LPDGVPDRLPDTGTGSTPAAGSPTVSVIVVSYNTRAMTLDCLRSLAAETKVSHEVIVVDNASTDGSAAAIAAEFPGIRLMAETANHGFAAATNLAAAEARGDYLLLLNPDTVVLDGAVDRLLAFAQARPEAGIWGGRTLYGDGRLNPASCWRRMTPWNLFCRASGLTGLFPGSGLFNPEAYGGWPRDTERAVDIVTGCFLLIRRDLWQRLGGFDPAFFMYGEEADLCLRARALGAAPRVTPEATIVHHGGASERVRADKMVRLLTAKAELIERHLPAWQRPLARPLLRLWPLSRRIATGALAAATGRATLAESAANWAEIWRRRAEWRGGYRGALPRG